MCLIYVNVMYITQMYMCCLFMCLIYVNVMYITHANIFLFLCVNWASLVQLGMFATMIYVFDIYQCYVYNTDVYVLLCLCV